MKPSEILAKPESWTQKAFARDECGIRVSSSDPAAESWCLLGACHHPMNTAVDAKRRIIDKLLETGQILRGSDRTKSSAPRSVEAWNDAPRRTHAEVIALLKSCDL